MNMKTTLLPALIAGFLLAAASSPAKVTLSERFDGRGSGEAHGLGENVRLPDGMKAWRSSRAGHDPEGGDYLLYDLAAVRGFNPEVGSIAFSLQRGEELGNESIFGFADEAGGRLFSFRVRWESTIHTKVETPELGFFGAEGQHFWFYRTRSDPYPGDFYAVPFGKKVAKGQWVDVLLTWGGTDAERALYVDGVKLDAVVEEPFGLSGLLARARTLYLGAEPTGKGKGVYAMTRSPVKDFRIYDTALTPEQLDRTPPEPVARVLADAAWGGELRTGWTASPSKDVAKYEIYRGAGAPPDLEAAPLQTTGLLEFVDTDVVPGIEYFYRIVAADEVGYRSAPSETVRAKATAGDGPRIASLAVEPAGKPLRPGETVKIVLLGAPGGKGLADIQGLRADLALEEVGGRTGRYEGLLPITEAEVADARRTLQVVGKLADDYGESRLAGPPITIVSAADLADKTPPKIGEITHDGFRQAGFSGKLVAGDTLTVTLSGEAGGVASFRLSGVTGPQPMTEAKPGVYTGTYTLGWGDEGEKVAVEGTLADFAGNETTAAAAKTVSLDTRVRLSVTAKEGFLPADRESGTRLTVRAENADGDVVEGHELALTLSTTAEYTGVVGGGRVEDKFAAKDDVDDIEVKWGGVTDGRGELSASYTAGFAAKTALVLAKDLTTGDVGAGWVNTYVASTVAIELLPRAARDAADLAEIRMSLTPSWLTADGRSKSRVKVWLTDLGGAPLAGAAVNFTLGGANGSIRLLRGVTDGSGLAEAEYRAGTLAGFETITAAAPDYHVTRSMQIELRSDAPAKIDLTASAVSLPADGRSKSEITAVVSDIHDNRNPGVPVMFRVVEGGGGVAPGEAVTSSKGVAVAAYTAGTAPGIAVVEARHTSRAPTVEELRRIQGTIFVPRLYEDQEGDRIKVKAWLAEEGDEVAKGQPLAEVETGEGTWTLPAPEKGVLVRHVRHPRDRVETGETLGYVEIDVEVWEAEYAK
jgi:biotin carboxyl carrier protein